mgnify:CR=1 FL=1
MITVPVSIAVTADEKRPHHEQFARGFEAYAFEGKAPSLELQPFMRRFAAWLKQVYGSIKKFLATRGQAGGPPMALNDDIRRVMDRMLATEQQIAEAETRDLLGAFGIPIAEAPEPSNRKGPQVSLHLSSDHGLTPYQVWLLHFPALTGAAAGQDNRRCFPSNTSAAKPPPTPASPTRRSFAPISRVHGPPLPEPRPCNPSIANGNG